MGRNRGKLREICDDHQKEILIKNRSSKRRSRTGKNDIPFVNYFAAYFVYHIEDSSTLKLHIYCSKKKEESKKQGGIYENRQNHQSPIHRYSPAAADMVFCQISGQGQHDHRSNQRRKGCPV